MVALLAAFSVGVLVDSAQRTYFGPRPARHEIRLDPDAIRGRHLHVASVSPDTPKEQILSSRIGPAHVGPIATTGTASLRLPIDGMDVESIKDGFNELRGDHPHEAVDVLAPRNTPVIAVQSGTIAKLFFSKRGGRTIYQFDPSGRLCYYYAHLERYAEELHEGDWVLQGRIIGYVGTSGNAPLNTPHLHFAVFELGEERKWWKGHAIDPYPLFTKKDGG